MSSTTQSSGQIVAVWHDDAARTVEGTSFLSWLEEQRWGERSSGEGG
ncbi:MAG: hypothetical protein IT372_33400 [Polyangiaceae bacterium]|nr:hypothetical protein [Polyangiaceae bacterium]